MNKFVFILLSVLLMPAKVVAMDEDPIYDFEVDGLCYKFLDVGQGVALTSRYGGYWGYMNSLPDSNLVIPSIVSYEGHTYPVEAIAPNAFYHTNQLVSITFPESLNTIGNSAFYGCRNLVGPLVFPDSLKTIGVEAFYGCTSLQGMLTLPESLTSLGTNAFINCDGITAVTFNCCECVIDADPYKVGILPTSITELVIGENVKKIPTYLAFGCNALTSLTIPKSVERIGSKAFNTCTSVTKVNWNARHCAAADPLPASCEEITIGEEVEYIPSFIAEASKISSIIIPNSVKVISTGAFKDCANLASVTLGNSLTKLCNQVFMNCSQLTSITIPASVSDIFTGKDGTFRGCSSLSSINVEAGNSVFNSHDNCNAIIMTETNELILGCDNTIIPNSVKIIGSYAFENCNEITHVVLPDELTTINSGAFSGCTGLSEITIPMTVLDIKDLAFAGCTGLDKITSLALRPPRIISGINGTFYGVSKDIPIYVPKESIQTYWIASGWSDFNYFYALNETCDVNNDGVVDIADVNMVINAMLGKPFDIPTGNQGGNTAPPHKQ